MRRPRKDWLPPPMVNYRWACQLRSITVNTSRSSDWAAARKPCTSLPPAARIASIAGAFPHAIAWHLRGGNVDASQKRKQRRALLEEAGIDLSTLTNIDLIDAAFCALTAYHAATGGACVSFGEPNSGLIIVPAFPYASGLVWSGQSLSRHGSPSSCPGWQSR